MIVELEVMRICDEDMTLAREAWDIPRSTLKKGPSLTAADDTLTDLAIGRLTGECDGALVVVETVANTAVLLLSATFEEGVSHDVLLNLDIRRRHEELAGDDEQSAGILR